MAIGLSGLCVVHCLATAVVLGLLASAGGLLGAPWIHEVGLTLAMLLGAVALGRGVFEHGFMMPSAVGGLGLGVMAGALTMPHDGSEALYTVVGVLGPRARPSPQCGWPSDLARAQLSPSTIGASVTVTRGFGRVDHDSSASAEVQGRSPSAPEHQRDGEQR